MLNTFDFRVLDATVSLTGPADLLTPIVRAYGRFRVEPGGPPADHSIRIDSADAASFQDGPATVPLIDGADPTLQVYERFLNALFDRIQSYAVLHAGALIDSSGGALLIAGPSGFGKTSLTLELLERGLGFLSDDYAPLDLKTGEVQPYPRTVGLLPGGSAKTPARFIEAAADPALPRLLGKALIDVGEVLGDGVLAKGPVPIRNVVVLDAGGANDERSFIDFGVWPRGVEEVARELEGIQGLAIVARNDRDDLSVWRVELDHSELPTERFSELLERDFVAFSETRPAASPDFGSKPLLAPVTRREAALLLCREMQNRRRRGGLMRGYGGDTTAMFLDVAAALLPARCYKLRVGEFEATADLLQQLGGLVGGPGFR